MRILKDDGRSAEIQAGWGVVGRSRPEAVRWGCRAREDTVAHDVDAVRVLGRNTMRDRDHRTAGFSLVKRVLRDTLSRRRTGGSKTIARATAILLTTGEKEAVLTDQSVVAERELADETVHVRLHKERGN